MLQVLPPLLLTVAMAAVDLRHAPSRLRFVRTAATPASGTPPAATSNRATQRRSGAVFFFALIGAAQVKDTTVALAQVGTHKCLVRSST